MNYRLMYLPRSCISSENIGAKIWTYNGAGYTWTHLRLYRIAISQCAHNVSFLYRPFATAWMVMHQLALSILIKQNEFVKDLANAFVVQYKLNSEILPDRFESQKESIEPGESFHEYARPGELRLLKPSLLWANESWSRHSYPLWHHLCMSVL